MKYAIVESGGKQYKAVEGQTIEVDRLQVEVGKKVELSDVYLVSDDGQVTVGTPKVAGAKVTATVSEHILGPKLIIFKYRPKQRYRVKTGHRQQYTRLTIESIAGKDGKVTARKAESVAEAAPVAEVAAEVKPVAEKKPAAKPKAAPKTKTAAKKPAAKSAPKKPAAKSKTSARKPAAKKTTK